MALFRRFFFRKPPDGLLEISERLYVFKSCFNTSALEEDEYKNYVGSMVGQLRDQFPDASFMVFNFREGENQSQIASILSSYDMTVMDYPCQYEGCPLLTMEVIHHFLRSSESWLLLGQQNLLLMNCERGWWPVLAFMLSALLIYRKQFTSEQRALDMIYKQVPQELLRLTMPVDPTPSQLRYLQYISRRNVGSQWPPLDRALTLDCVILRVVPNLGGKKGSCPIFRIYVRVPLMAADRSADIPPPKRGKHFGHDKRADCELVKIDIHCPVQGDVVLECTSLDGDQERELMIFRVMLNTSFIKSNNLVLNHYEIDTLWDIKDRFPKDFRAEVLFSEMDSATSSTSIDLSCLGKRDGLPVEVFAKNRRIVSTMNLPDGKNDAEHDMLQHISAFQENLDAVSHQRAETGSVLLESRLEKVQERQKQKEPENESTSQEKPRSSSSATPLTDGDLIREKDESRVLNVVQPDTNLNWGEVKPQELPDEPQSFTASKPVPNANSTEEKFEPQEIRIATQSVPFFAPSPDSNSTERNFALQEQQFALQLSPQSKIISQRVPQSSLAAPVSYSNSLQESPMPVSRYHNAPPAVGIMALLHDCAVSKGEEVMRPVTLSLPSSTILSPITNASKAVKLGNLSTLKALPQQPYLSLQSPAEVLTTVENFPQAHPLPLCQMTSKAIDSSPTQHPEKSSSPILLPPLPSNPELFPSPAAPVPPPPPPLPPPSLSSSTEASSLPVPPPPPSFPIKSPCLTIKKSYSTPPPLPPQGADLVVSGLESSMQSVKDAEVVSKSPQPSPPPVHPCTGPVLAPTIATSVSSPPPSPSSSLKDSSSCTSTIPPLVPPVPSLPDPFVKGPSKACGVSSHSHFGIGNGNADVPPVPGPPSIAPFSAKGRGLRSNPRNQVQQRKANLKPYHWLKLTRAMQGSLWAETQKFDEASEAPEFDISELESLFSVSASNSDTRSTWKKSNKCTPGHKSDKVQLVELRRAYNCEIMLSKVKIPLSDLMTSVLALDDSVLDVDQIDNMIKFCPTKEEMELLKGYIGDKENLGKCEQFFLELMKVPRLESKLRVFSFKLQFHPQVSELRNSLNVINSASEEIRSSVKLKRIMQAILSLGNALNHGTARGSAIGFRLDSLLKLADTRSGNNKMTLMHYLCKVLAEKLPELLDLPKDLVNLEAATKIQLKYLAEEMQAINKGLEKVEQELTASENDGPVSENFCQTLRPFLTCAESEVRSMASFYSSAGRNADALALYFGEDPGRCPFEQVVSILRNFMRMFVQAHEENCKQLEFEKKKAESNAENGISKMCPCKKESQRLIRTPIKRGNIK